MRSTLLQLIMLQEIDININQITTNLESIDSLEATVSKETRQALMVTKQQIIKSIDPKVVSTYEKLKARRGQALAEVKNSCCLQCRMVVRPSLLSQVYQRCQIVECDHCGCILYCVEAVYSNA